MRVALHVRSSSCRWPCPAGPRTRSTASRFAVLTKEGYTDTPVTRLSARQPAGGTRNQPAARARQRRRASASGSKERASQRGKDTGQACNGMRGGMPWGRVRWLRSPWCSGCRPALAPCTPRRDCKHTKDTKATQGSSGAAITERANITGRMDAAHAQMQTTHAATTPAKLRDYQYTAETQRQAERSGTGQPKERNAQEVHLAEGHLAQQHEARVVLHTHRQVDNAIPN